MAGNTFDQIAKAKFNYLLTDYGCVLVTCKKVAGGYEMLFTNAVTGIQITYEFREAYVFVTICKLINGRLVENPHPIEPKSMLTCFSLDDILTLRNPAAIMKPAYQYGVESEFYNPATGLELYVGKFAENVRQYASDVLNGDFRLFEALEPIVKERASHIVERP